jgi:hypothetical protein
MDQAIMFRVRERAYHIWAAQGGADSDAHRQVSMVALVRRRGTAFLVAFSNDQPVQVTQRQVRDRQETPPRPAPAD